MNCGGHLYSLTSEFQLTLARYSLPYLQVALSRLLTQESLGTTTTSYSNGTNKLSNQLNINKIHNAWLL